MSRFSRMLNGGYNPRRREHRRCGCTWFCQWVDKSNREYLMHAQYRRKKRGWR